MIAVNYQWYRESGDEELDHDLVQKWVFRPLNVKKFHEWLVGSVTEFKWERS